MEIFLISSNTISKEQKSMMGKAAMKVVLRHSPIINTTMNRLIDIASSVVLVFYFTLDDYNNM